MFCKKCNKEQSDDNKFCTSCGQDLFLLSGSKGSSGDLQKVLLSLLSPFIALFVVVSIWGFVNILYETVYVGSKILHVLKITVPFLVSLTILSIPGGVILAIYFYTRGRE